MKIVFACSSGIFAAVSSLYYVWILQLNSYRYSRAAKDMIFSLHSGLSFLFSALQIVLLFFAKNVITYYSFCVNLLLCGWLLLPKKTPIKFTKRVWRWAVVILATCILSFLFLNSYVVCLAQILVVIVADIILLPLNGAINCYYVKKAQKKLKQTNGVVVAVVGSMGKTSVKNILKAFLSTKFKTECSPSSFNTPLGIAKFINSTDFSTRVLIVEAGAKKRGDIAKICRLFKPRHAVITGIAEQHLSTFKSIDNIIKAKGEVLDRLSDGGVCVINADNEYCKSYFNKGVAQKLSVGKTGKDCRIKNVLNSPNGTQADLIFNGKTYHIFTPLLGEISAFNVALSFCMAVKLGCNPDLLVQEAAKLDFVPHRLQLLRVGKRFVIDDSYNANTVGLKCLLDVVKGFNGNKLIVAQGIVEQGKKGKQVNRLAGVDMAKIADAVAVSGKNKRVLAEGLADGGLPQNKIFVCETVKDAVNKLAPFLTDGSVIAFQNDLPDKING